MSGSHGWVALRVILAIMAMPVAVGVAMWGWKAHVEFRGCDFRFNSGPGALTYSAHSIHVDGEIQEITSNAALSAASFNLRAVLMEPLSVDAYNDLTYVGCSMDWEERSALVWFSEIRSDAFTKWLERYAERHREVQPGRFDAMFTTPAIASGDDRERARLNDTRALLRSIAVVYQSGLPEWVPPSVLKDPHVFGWLDGAVLLRTDVPGSLLLLNTRLGLTGRMLPDGQCLEAANDNPMCEEPSIHYRMLPIGSLIRAGDFDAAREEAVGALAEEVDASLRGDIAHKTLSLIRQAPGIQARCPEFYKALGDFSLGVSGTPINFEPNSGSQADFDQVAELVRVLSGHRCLGLPHRATSHASVEYPSQDRCAVASRGCADKVKLQDSASDASTSGLKV